MKFARRAEGIAAARSVFKRSREDPKSRYHVYICAALMEYYSSKSEDIAIRIFEHGLKKYPGDVNYILKYLGHLSHHNDDNTTRYCIVN